MGNIMGAEDTMGIALQVCGVQPLEDDYTPHPRPDTNSLSHWDDKKLKVLCREFRKGMLARKSSKGKCATVTWALQGFISFATGIQTAVYESTVGRWNHLYLVMPDGRVIDCTADQFNPKGKRKYPQAYIGEPLDIHSGGKPCQTIR